MLTVESQPDALVCVTETVPEAKFPQLMLTLLELDGPLMLPPVTLHAYVSPATAGTEYVPAVNLQSELGPLITGVGLVNRVMVRLEVESQPYELVWVTVTVPDRDEPHDTVIELEVEEPLILPPVTVHA